jgi:hypothetical protein
MAAAGACDAPSRDSTLREMALIMAAQAGEVDRVARLLADPGSDAAAEDSLMLRTAASDGCLPIVTLLLNDESRPPRCRADPAALNNAAIRAAARKGHWHVVRALLRDPRVDPGARNQETLLHAAAHGDAAIVKLLMRDPRVDPGAVGAVAVFAAAGLGRYRALAALIEDPRVDPVQAAHGAQQCPLVRPKCRAQTEAVITVAVRWRRRRAWVRVAV